MKKLFIWSFLCSLPVFSLHLNRLPRSSTIQKKWNSQLQLTHRNFCSALQVKHILEPLKEQNEKDVFKDYTEAGILFKQVRIFNSKLEEPFRERVVSWFQSMQLNKNLIEANKRFMKAASENYYELAPSMMLPMYIPLNTGAIFAFTRQIHNLALLNCGHAVLEQLKKPNSNQNAANV